MSLVIFVCEENDLPLLLAQLVDKSYSQIWFVGNSDWILKKSS